MAASFYKSHGNTQAPLAWCRKQAGGSSSAFSGLRPILLHYHHFPPPHTSPQAQAVRISSSRGSQLSVSVWGLRVYRVGVCQDAENVMKPRAFAILVLGNCFSWVVASLLFSLESRRQRMAIALCHNGESLSHSGDHIRLGTTGTHENGLTPRWGCPLDEVCNLLNRVHLWGQIHATSCRASRNPGVISTAKGWFVC